ncbi:MAG TPA: cation diffusion facilitator family transporter [Thermoanaerobaculaceae bacterium]|nr:cation diffusion facilitator family transporter [Thermoanaerobaculaceae bacterium]
MLTRWLVRRFVESPDEVGRPLVRKSYGVLEGWVSVAVNLLVFAVKFVPGVLIGSIALVADAFHSLGDVLSSGVIIWGFKAAARPSDSRHPFGHGRMENVATLVIGILLFVAAWEFGQNSVIRLYEPRPVHSSALLIAVLALTMVAKEWLSRFARTLATRIHSSALEGDFLHHRSDVLATAVVIVSLLATNQGWHWVDGVGGLVIAAFIAAAAFKLTSDSINPLIGEAPSPGVIDEIRRAAMSVPEVDDVHDLTVHSYGGAVAISLHIEITCDLDLTRAHDVAEAVESALNERFGGASVVHIDPVNRAHPLYQPVRQFLDQLLPAVPGATGFHDLRIVGSDEPCYVILDLEAETEQAQGAASRVRSEVAGRFPAVAKVVVNLEPRYVY